MNDDELNELTNRFDEYIPQMFTGNELRCLEALMPDMQAMFAGMGPNSLFAVLHVKHGLAIVLPLPPVNAGFEEKLREHMLLGGTNPMCIVAYGKLSDGTDGRHFHYPLKPRPGDLVTMSEIESWVLNVLGVFEENGGLKSPHDSPGIIIELMGERS